ncbi:MAG: ABC transporter substrate-binding protein [Betaproteobacteria bacterium]|nr:ABC transporter substrate-binding protein [Betaproteobacteria bacterium]
MKRISIAIALVAALCGSQIVMAASLPPIPTAIISELSGTGATAGTNFKDGLVMALKEINAAGGVLGRQVSYDILDSQSTPSVAKAMAQKAVDSGADVVFGPGFSGSVIVSMRVTQQAKIPNIVGAEAANITQEGDPYVFRTSFSQMSSMPKVEHYLKNVIKAKSVAMLWVNNDFGKGGRDVLASELKKDHIPVVADISSDPGQIDFTAAVLKAKQSKADALFVYLNEEESARALRELRKQGYSKPIIGETTLAGEKVIELAGDAANGVVCHVGLTVDAPSPLLKSFGERFQKIYGYKPDHNGIKGYTAAYMMKAGFEKAGKIDPQALDKALHGLYISTKKYPGILMDVKIDDKGDLDRESFMVKVENGKGHVFMTLPPLSPL